MILQSFLFPDEVFGESQLYYRVRGTYREEDLACKGKNRVRIVLAPGSVFSSDTYMNLMDADSWRKYTKVEQVYLCVTVAGSGKLILMEMGEEGEEDRKRKEWYFSGKEIKAYSWGILEKDFRGMLYFRVEAETEVVFYEAFYFSEDRVERDIKISLVICTYKREEQLAKNLERLGESDFFREDFWQNKKLCIRVVDNSSELKIKEEWKRENWYFYSNRNTGGAGGFTRGILESQRDRDRFLSTHILLMDDDIEFQTEALYRLYALLSFVREEYLGEVIAGRMFCLDQRTVQYTASDIWNGGMIQHVGACQDMGKREFLYRMNQERGEYSGWWFACFPMEYTVENLPMPFFLHCDDVEYGLRHGGRPIVLNGIQVWHETYYYRQSAVIHYYDVRNTAFTNAKIHYPRLKIHLIKCWFLGLLSNIKHRRWKQEYMKLLAIKDYWKGEEWLYRIDPEENHWRICREAKREISFFRILLEEAGVWIRVLCKKM